MNIYTNLGRIARLGVLFVVLFTSFSSVPESLFDRKIVDITKKSKGKYTLQFDDIGVELALNDSTFLLKVEV